MKKLLSIVSALVLSGSSLTAVVACNPSNDKVITYGYVNNNTDKDATELFKTIENQFYKLYGNEYTLKGVRYDDENTLPDEMLKIGNSSAPDTFGVSSDMAAKLATQALILALEGQDSPTGANTIIEKMNYTVEHSTEVMTKYDKDPSAVTDTEMWSTWLPYAVETSKIKSNNASAKEKTAVQYGITKHLGVGGGSALISTNTASQKIFTEDLNMATYNSETGGYDWNDKTASINDIIEVSAKQTNVNANGSKKANGYMPFLIDRGMWWMYPVYANIMSNDINGKTYRAADIGMNWVNDSTLAYADSSEGTKYSSLWSNSHFKTSREEVLGKWFELFSQQMKVALNTLDGSTAAETAQNLTDPSQNAQVQANMIKKQFSGGINYEPGNYFDMLTGFGEFSNMDYIELQKLELFDETDEASLYKKYNDAGLNKWMTPAGSGMVVFNSKLGRNAEKLRMTEKFVQLQFGIIEDVNGNVTYDENGGIYNLNDGFVTIGDHPAKMAIIDEKFRDEETFIKGMATRVEAKYNRAIAEVSGYKDKEKTPGFKEKEIAAIKRLENFSSEWAANLYKETKPAVSLAPNVSAYDTATDNDWHGNQAMKPALDESYYFSQGSSKFESIYGKFDEISIEWLDSIGFTDEQNKFITKMVAKLKELNDNQSKNN